MAASGATLSPYANEDCADLATLLPTFDKLLFGGTADLVTRKLMRACPLCLRTGKRLQDRLTELVVTFDEVPQPREEPRGRHEIEAREPRSRRELQDAQLRRLRAAADGHRA